MQQQEQADLSSQQLRFPFKISNRPYNPCDPCSKNDRNIDRYLTFKNQKHPIESKHLVEFQKEHQNPDSHYWKFEQVKKGDSYRIKHLTSGFYLTLTQGKTPNIYKKKNWNQYLVELLPLIQGQGSQTQEWSFELGKHRRFKIKSKAAKDKVERYLESVEDHRLLDGYKSVILCRPETNPERKHLQNWKLSPLIPKPPQRQFNLQQFLDCKCLQEQKVHLRRFKGKIFKKGNSQYNKMRDQYATSSYPGQQMEPYMLAYPTDIADIKTIIEMVKPSIESKKPCKKIVARSGGHQYSGLSSGGDDTIVISLDLFNKYLVNNEGLVEIEPCVPLKVASKFLRDNKLSVPHGVCPLVNIGGHGQTGGYGHFTRVFGLLIDYIQAFDIVLADGTFKEKVSRPTPTNAQDLQLFRGVMGGNAGSFGIVTKFYIKGIRDQDHPNSETFSNARFFNEKTFKAVMKEYQRWTQLIADNNDESIKGLDLLFSLTQFEVEWLGIKTTAMSLTGFYGDPDGNKPYKGQFKKIFDTFKEGQTWAEWGLNSFFDLSNGKAPLSQIAEGYVLKFPSVTCTGREYNLPYKKRGNVTVCALTDEFIDQITQQTAQVVAPKEDLLHLVIQMITGGGQYKKKGEEKINNLSITSIPLRNLTHTFSFDVFYEQGGEQRAEDRQKIMQSVVEKHYSGQVGQKIFFWTSFGTREELDMSKPSVVKKFYDSQEQYGIVQQLKSKVDPNDIFSTVMTVKPKLLKA